MLIKGGEGLIYYLFAWYIASKHHLGFDDQPLYGIVYININGHNYDTVTPFSFRK